LKIYYVGDKPLRYTREYFKESAALFKELDRKERFDILHSQSIAGLSYAKSFTTGPPMVVTFHGTAIKEIKTVLRGYSSLKQYLTFLFG